MKPVNGQIIDDVSKLDNIVDSKGKKIKFTQEKDIDNDLVYCGKGSDGKTYTAQLEKKTLSISIYDTPQEKKEKKAIEERGQKLRQGGNITGDIRDAKSNDDKEPVKEDKDKKDNKFFNKK